MSETDDDQCNCEARRCEMEECPNCAVGNLPFCSAHRGDDEPRRLYAKKRMKFADLMEFKGSARLAQGMRQQEHVRS